ncbi:MAG: hypothetical protein KF781_01155 [Chitinophagaceae bacterium]|nr:hypothetical protein [Chitinophagaceae bacterium]MCW5905343.1 hypothetical protein [Chitinophagaceae bacterium]
MKKYFLLKANNHILYVSIVLVFSFTSCVSSKIANYTFNRKLPTEKLQSDIKLLKNILEANHPSLYWYTEKDSIDYYFNNAINDITDSLSEIQFRNKVASVISKIRCGHTSVRFSKDFSEQAKNFLYPLFPLHLKVWNDSLVVISSAFKNDSIFKRGTIITSVNGKNAAQLLDTMYQFISTDGYSNNYKNQVITNSFPLWYKTIFGIDSSYTITYIDSVGKEATTNIKNYIPIKDTTIKTDTLKKVEKIATPTRKQIRQAKLLAKRSIQIDTSINTAYIKLNTFSKGRLNIFFRKSLKKIEQTNIENVVIDLRQNGGGNVATTSKTLKYFVDKPFKHGDTVAAISRTFPYRKHIKNWFLYWTAMNFFAKKGSDNKIHFKRYEKHYYKPKTKYHFNGNIYLVQGGVTFSAATMFISTLKGQSNVTVIGEETGGGYYGNSAMHIPTIVLPNSKLRVSLPMYRLVIDKNRPKGRGIMPDIEVPPSSAAIKEGYDIKLTTIRKLILKGMK